MALPFRLFSSMAHHIFGLYKRACPLVTPLLSWILDILRDKIFFVLIILQFVPHPHHFALHSSPSYRVPSFLLPFLLSNPSIFPTSRMWTRHSRWLRNAILVSRSSGLLVSIPRPYFPVSTPTILPTSRIWTKDSRWLRNPILVSRPSRLLVSTPRPKSID